MDMRIFSDPPLDQQLLTFPYDGHMPPRYVCHKVASPHMHYGIAPDLHPDFSYEDGPVREFPLRFEVSRSTGLWTPSLSGLILPIESEWELIASFFLGIKTSASWAIYHNSLGTHRIRFFWHVAPTLQFCMGFDFSTPFIGDPHKLSLGIIPSPLKTAFAHALAVASRHLFVGASARVVMGIWSQYIDNARYAEDLRDLDDTAVRTIPVIAVIPDDMPVILSEYHLRPPRPVDLHKSVLCRGPLKRKMI